MRRNTRKLKRDRSPSVWYIIGVIITYFQYSECDLDIKQAIKMEKELRKMESRGALHEKKCSTLKGTALAVGLTSKLSPKPQRKKEPTKNIAQLKVSD